MTTLVAWLIRVLNVDRGVALAVASRTLQLIAAPVSLLVIARFFSPELQGFHYTFMSLIALQSFAELGFSIVIVNTASHQWASLALDGDRRITGDPDALSRLVSLGRLTARWYAVASVIFVALAGTLGFWFFGGSSNQIRWQEPWMALVVIAGAQLWMLSFTSILEGCNQIAEVYAFRVAQSVLCNIAFWTAAALGGGLWAGVAMAAARLLVDVALVGVRYRAFFSVFRERPLGPPLRWRTDIWPMQWRLALSGLTHYFSFSMLTPVLFHYHGAIAAGQMGLTWQAIGGIQSIAMVWLTTRVPAFGRLIARRSRAELDALWSRVSLVSLGIFVTGAVGLWLPVYWLARVEHPLASRLLAPGPTGLMLLGMFLIQVAQCQTIYMRAHRQEPILVMSMVTSLLMGAAIWALGSTFAALGAAIGVASVAAILLTWESGIWWRFRGASMPLRPTT